MSHSKKIESLPWNLSLAFSGSEVPMKSHSPLSELILSISLTPLSCSLNLIENADLWQILV